MTDKMIIQIFSDESGWEGANQFGSLAKIVGEKNVQKSLNEELGNKIKQYGTREFKFKNVNNFKNVNLGKELIDILLRYVANGNVGAYILVWDKKDSRHNIQGRCDLSNLCRMYYHNLKAIKRQRQIDCEWEFYPDEFSAINWHEDIIAFLTNRKLGVVVNSDPDLFDFYSNLKITYTKVKALKSEEYPLLQLADLLAGLCRTSRQEHNLYRHWKNNNNKQIPIFDYPSNHTISKTLTYKFIVKEYFKEQCDKYRLGVNISRNGYLQTFKPSSKISIWNYEPQSSNDKAPVRQSV